MSNTNEKDWSHEVLSNNKNVTVPILYATEIEQKCST